jgi:hypothetical protein
MSLALLHSSETAMSVASPEVYVQSAGLETFDNAVVLERPPRHLI